MNIWHIHTFQLSFGRNPLRKPKRKEPCHEDYLPQGTISALTIPSESSNFCTMNMISRGVLMKEKPCMENRVKLGAIREGTYRTGWPPIRDTAASVRSIADSIGPSGTPRRTAVSTFPSSESDQSSSAIRFTLMSAQPHHENELIT